MQKSLCEIPRQGNAEHQRCESTGVVEVAIEENRISVFLCFAHDEFANLVC